MQKKAFTLEKKHKKHSSPSKKKQATKKSTKKHYSVIPEHRQHIHKVNHMETPIPSEGEAQESAGESALTVETGEAGDTQSPAHEQSPLTGESG